MISDCCTLLHVEARKRYLRSCEAPRLAFNGMTTRLWVEGVFGLSVVVYLDEQLLLYRLSGVRQLNRAVHDDGAIVFIATGLPQEGQGCLPHVCVEGLCSQVVYLSPPCTGCLVKSHFL